MSRKKPLSDVRGNLTSAQIAARRAAENPAFAPGEPPMPQGLDRKVRAEWRRIAAILDSRGLLARSDGELLLEWAEAAAAGEPCPQTVFAVFKDRQPFASDTAAPVAAPAAALPPAPNAADTAKLYAADVLGGQIVAGKFVRQACERFIGDLRDGPARGITFDSAAAQHVVSYISALDLGRLMPWQVFILANIFGFKNASGLRRFRTAHLEVAKKNGKSSFLAAIGLYMADPEGDHEERSQVYVAATTKQQSKDICFKEALRLREKSETVSARSARFKCAIEFQDSVFEPLAANSEKLNGRNIHCGILDELADHATADLFHVFTSSKVGRKQPLTISITTAGNVRGENVAWAQRTHSLQVLEGVIPDEAFFAFICTLDEGDNWADEKMWAKANPSLGTTVQIDSLRELAARAHALPSAKNSFLRFHLDIWPSTTTTSWINADDLLKLGNAYLTEDERNLTWLERVQNAELRLKGRRAVMGLDLALRNDLSVLAILFPPTEDGGIFEVLFKCWVPEDDIEIRTREHRVPYQQWAEAGILTATPGQVTDFAYIRRDILEIRKLYNIVELGADAALGDDLLQQLRDEGLAICKVKQGMWLSEIISRLERLFIQHKMCFHGNPLAAWCFSNVSLGTNALHRLRFDKEKSREKIDAAVALANAFTRTLEMPEPNPYENRGLIFLDNALPPGKVL
jgi:phage terminase large subunit-like protein